MENKVITKEVIVNDLKNLGIQRGDRLNVKVSLKSIGYVEGGVNTLIEALLEVVGKEGTIFTDSFVKHYEIPNIEKVSEKDIVNDSTPSYAGTLANALYKYPGAKRSPHPIQKFAAIGADADWVLEHDVDSEPYSVLHRLAMNGGKNLKIGAIGKVHGVGTTHCAIETLKWRQKMPVKGVVYLRDGKKKVFYHNWPTGCMKSFDKLMPLYELNGGVLSKGVVGNATAYVTDMRKTYELEVSLGNQLPNILRCNDPDCIRCRLGWEHSRDNLLSVLWHFAIHFRAGRFVRSLQYYFNPYEPR